jgi:hypothetical protein
LSTRGVGESLELDQKDFLSGALQILVVLGVTEVVVLHAVGLLRDRSRHGESKGGHRPRCSSNLHVFTVFHVGRANNAKGIV